MYVFETARTKLVELSKGYYRDVSATYKKNHGRSLRQYAGSGYAQMRLLIINSYLEGAAKGITDQMAAKHRAFSSSTALVVCADKAIKDFADTHFTNNKGLKMKKRTTVDAAYSRGYNDGLNLHVNPALETQANKQIVTA